MGYAAGNRHRMPRVPLVGWVAPGGTRHVGLLDEQVEVHVLPSGAGKSCTWTIALGQSASTTVWTSVTGAEGLGTEDVDVTGQQGCATAADSYPA
jgi:hypothetical protein